MFVITNFKIFESINRPYKIGDFLIVKFRKKDSLLVNEIVKIIDIKNKTVYAIKPDDEQTNYIIENYMIQYWSESKEELEALLASEKYNL